MELTDIVLYADMIECRHHQGIVHYEQADALLIEGASSHILYSAAKTEAAGQAIVAHLPKHFDILVTHDTYTDPYLKKQRHLTCGLQCLHAVYVKKEAPVPQLSDGFTIQRLTTQHLPAIIRQYRQSMADLAKEAYLTPVLEDGMYGAFYGKELCGFIGVHEQESMGLLEIMPAWRRKGLAIALEQFMIGRQLERGRLPYAEIVKDNIASLRLQKRLGMKVGKELTYWYFP